MNLAILILKQSNLQLLCLTEQLEYEPAVHMRLPYTISGTSKLTLTRWPAYTDDDHILIRSDELLTVCEPTEKLKEAYMKKTGLTEQDLKPKPQRTILTEDESIPEVPEVDDEYEPRYLEEEA